MPIALALPVSVATAAVPVSVPAMTVPPAVTTPLPLLTISVVEPVPPSLTTPPILIAGPAVRPSVIDDAAAAGAMVPGTDSEPVVVKMAEFP